MGLEKLTIFAKWCLEKHTVLLNEFGKAHVVSLEKHRCVAIECSRAATNLFMYSRIYVKFN